MSYHSSINGERCPYEIEMKFLGITLKTFTIIWSDMRILSLRPKLRIEMPWKILDVNENMQINVEMEYQAKHHLKFAYARRNRFKMKCEIYICFLFKMCEKKWPLKSKLWDIFCWSFFFILCVYCIMKQLHNAANETKRKSWQLFLKAFCAYFCRDDFLLLLLSL